MADRGTAEWAAQYCGRGWSPIGLHPRSKKPIGNGWQTRALQAADLDGVFANGENVGLRLGPASAGLVDIDLDSPEARRAANTMLVSAARFGRQTHGTTHVFLTCPDLPPDGLSRKYNDPEAGKGEKACLLELRAQPNLQTMVPPSIHPDGDRLEWSELGDPARVPLGELVRLVDRVAAVCLLARRWKRGSRNDTSLHLAGALLHSSVPKGDVLAFMGQVCSAAEDDETKSRLANVEVTASKIAGGQPTTGWPKLAEAIGEASCSKLKEWLGIAQDGRAALESESLLLDLNEPLRSAREYVRRKRPTLMHHNDDWLAHDGASYVLIEDDTIKSELYEFLDGARQRSSKGPEGPFRPTRAKVANVVDALEGSVHVPREVFEPPCWRSGEGPPPREVVACQNGLLHLPSGELLAPTPRFFTRNALAFDYVPTAPAPARWLSFLESLWPDGACTETLQEVFGYLLIPDTSQQKIFMLVGPPRSGKGTIARVLTALVGQANVCAPTLNSLGDPFGLQALIGKQLAVVSDMRLGRRTDHAAVAENLLRISGEDMVTANRKYKDEWHGHLSARFFIMTNLMPRFADVSGALASRFVPLVMQESFLGREDPRLVADLIEELPGILTWAITGWKRLHDRGHFALPPASREAVQALADASSPVGAFVREECELGPEFAVAKHELYGRWTNWCLDRGERPGSAEAFGRQLRATTRVGEARPRSEHLRVWSYTGIRLGPATTASGLAAEVI